MSRLGVTPGSVFEDPADEKSWHRAQRFESVARYYEGREPSWYAPVIRPLAGARRVLDLGCGPGLTMRALLEAGAESVVGIERWPGFARMAAPDTSVLLHDLTLPAPFLPSASFDGVVSHFVFEYISPIGLRQVLREAHRVLAPGGRAALYLVATGTGGGDEGKT
ncbi:MAG TPA: class I SAM-dependent methyltransferase, partial [Solirubrobacteraceae bacterium]